MIHNQSFQSFLKPQIYHFSYQPLHKINSAGAHIDHVKAGLVCIDILIIELTWGGWQIYILKYVNPQYNTIHKSNPKYRPTSSIHFLQVFKSFIVFKIIIPAEDSIHLLLKSRRWSGLGGSCDHNILARQKSESFEVPFSFTTHLLLKINIHLGYSSLGNNNNINKQENMDKLATPPRYL